MPGNHTLRAAIHALAALLLLSSCGGGGGSPPAVAGAAATYGITQSNLEIAAALYQDAQRTPPGFVSDPPPAGAQLVATRHLQSHDLSLTAAANYEVCTDNWNEALAWSEQTAALGGSYASLVGTIDTSRYFEFDRTRPGTPVLLLRQRVYLCSYLDRSNTSVEVGSGPAGMLNVRPETAADLRLLSEYLWRFTAWNNFGSSVLTSVEDPGAAELGHTLVIATLVRDAISSGCDRIDVLRWRHSLDAASGALQRSLATLWSFSAHQTGMLAVDCPPG